MHKRHFTSDNDPLASIWDKLLTKANLQGIGRDDGVKHKTTSMNSPRRPIITTPNPKKLDHNGK